MDTNTGSTKPVGGRGPTARVGRRNRNPCFACAQKKTRCKIVSLGLCEKCSKEGRGQCLPHVPWQDTIRAAQRNVYAQMTPAINALPDAVSNTFGANAWDHSPTQNDYSQYAFPGPPPSQSPQLIYSNTVPMVPDYNSGHPAANHHQHMDTSFSQHNPHPPSAYLQAGWNGQVGSGPEYGYHGIDHHHQPFVPDNNLDPQASRAETTFQPQWQSFSHAEYAFDMNTPDRASYSRSDKVDTDLSTNG